MTVQLGDHLPLHKVPYGSIVIMPDGGEVEVLGTNYSAWNHKTRSNAPTSVRIRQGNSGGLTNPDIIVQVKQLGSTRDLEWKSGTIVRVIGGKHVGKTGLVGKTTHRSGQVPVVSPEAQGEILRIKGSMLQRANGRLEVEDPT